MSTGTQDKAARAAAALADALAASATRARIRLPTPRRRIRSRIRTTVARQIVLRQLAMRPRAGLQLEQKLAERDCPP